MFSPIGIFILGWISVVGSVPINEENSKSLGTNFIGRGTNELATALLQGYVQKEENMVYSPFGYSAILAVFSEGARGASREEIANALHFPSDVDMVRQSYRSVLERLAAKKFTNSPEFKNWFYVYKNYTVEDELQNVLRKYYLTEVKCVDRPEDYIKETKKSPIKETMGTDQKIAMEMDKIPTETMNKMEDVKSNEENSAKAEEPMKSGVAAMENSEMNERSNDEDKKPMDVTKSEMMAPIKTEAEMGLMPVEHFSGMTDSSLKIRGQESKPRMVIFNGLYYKGEWETPFVKKQADDSRVFYKSDTEKVFVSTIHSQGVFNYGSILNLDCRAIELPYKGGRYSLLVLVPNTRNGLTKLISDLAGYTLNNIYDQLSEKLVEVCLPSFEINTISKPVSSLTKMGLTKVTSIFNPDTADLTGISSKDNGLYVEELVQMVTFKVDAEYSKANFLTASIASSRSNVQNFQINQPFLFYLRDNLEDIIIVNGKVIDPTPKPNFYFS